MQREPVGGKITPIMSIKCPGQSAVRSQSEMEASVFARISDSIICDLFREYHASFVSNAKIDLNKKEHRDLYRKEARNTDKSLAGNSEALHLCSSYSVTG